jgi:hypothetical protein
MKVQPCPACGARYNTTRLEDGASFQCRRCGADVVVGRSDARDRGSPGLALAGLLMVAATFLYANPKFGYAPRWPWEEMRSQTAWAERVTLIAWAFAGVWALLASLTPARRVRATVSIALASLLLFLTTSRSAGFRLDALSSLQGVAAVLLGAGLLLAWEEPTRAVGRALAFSGGLLLVAIPALRFPDGAVSEIESLANRLWATVASGDRAAPKGAELWEDLFPAWLLLTAGAMGILAGIGVTGRGWTIAGFCVLGAGILLPTLSTLVGDFEAVTRRDEARNLAFAGIVGSGLALWMLGTFAVVDLSRDRREAS